ncbi:MULTISPECIES: flavodoxin [Anaerosinus]|uniref:Flavodoxin n=1 Tax=Selenobaculum gibii TaxID=3054208 RepID=A0A9Y2ETU5_9FIRM|nr:flavodoxin [Selenobaculum gbiensis]WIW70490.1 flavodoxin [Selenobaculum gbiensis]
MKKVAVIYWSGSGNTEKMAKAMSKGVENSGNVGTLFHVSEFNIADMESFDRFAFGCPSMGCEVLEESEFEPLFTSIEELLKGKKVALFGSYGWGDGEWMRNWQDRVISFGADLFEEGLIINEVPDSEDEKKCERFGFNFAIC